MQRRQNTSRKRLTPPIAGIDRVRAALQDAIRLELATIPPYLTAMLTLTGNKPLVAYARLIKERADRS